MRITHGGITAVLALAIAASASGAYAATNPASEPTSQPANVARATLAGAPATPTAALRTPDLDWTECSTTLVAGATARSSTGTMDCAIAAVPLDYDRPDGNTIGIALKRRFADEPSKRIGTLFVNPGGPGGSGVDMVSSIEAILPPRLLARFDVVGFDPRGVARSAPLVCLPTPQDGFELLGSLPPFPLTPREEAHFATTIQQGLTDECARHGRPIIDHMSTANTARDLDLLRAAVGDRQLSYFGVSYGTLIGTTYANLFPDRVRALALDANIDPIAWTTGYSRQEGATIPVTTRLGSARSAYATLTRFFDRCRDAGPARCALASQDPAERYRRLAAQLQREPVVINAGGTPLTFTYAHLVAATLSTLNDPYSWAGFAQFVNALAGGSDAAISRAYREVHRSAKPADGTYETQSFEGFPGVQCADANNPTDPSAWAAAGRHEDHYAPYFGRMWTWRSIPCATWPGHDPGRYIGPWQARTANPVLVVGALNDPATPYAGAQKVASLLSGARLLTLNGEGHVSFGLSACINKAEADYLLTKALPPEGTVCQTDVDPFPGPSAHGLSDEQSTREQGRRALLAAARSEG